MMTIVFLVNLLFTFNSYAKLEWIEVSSEEDLSSMNHPFVVGTVEDDGTKRAICRFSRYKQVHVGKLIGDTCQTAIDAVDVEKTKQWSSILRVAYMLVSVDSSDSNHPIEILISTEENDHYWQSFEELNLDSPLFNAAFVISPEWNEEDKLAFRAMSSLFMDDDVAYICRAINKTNTKDGARERGLHTGQLYGVFNDGKCFYAYGDKGFNAPDNYTETFEVLMEVRE